MSLEGVSDLEVSVPDFELSVPADGGEVGGDLHFGGGTGRNVGESDTTDPVGVVVGS